MPEKLLGRVACPAALGTHMVSQVLIDMCMALDFRFTIGLCALFYNSVQVPSIRQRANRGYAVQNKRQVLATVMQNIKIIKSDKSG